MTKKEKEWELRAARDNLADTEVRVSKVVKNPHYHPDMIAAKHRYDAAVLAFYQE